MVAVVLVICAHLFDAPRGGFVGVDVFFVISGFLITGALLHRAHSGQPLFWWFYRRRIRRIVPAATLVLVVTCIAAYPILAAGAYDSLLTDSLWAFFFASNWRFASVGTDYFSATQAPSAVQHYWSLSVEEQFYLVWPAVLLLIGLVAVRGAWSMRVRLIASSACMAAIVVASFGYATIIGRSDPITAYFSTFARVWELGVGALVAIAATKLGRIPDRFAGVTAWSGLVLIAVGVAVCATDSADFRPWTLAVPVTGAALVLIGGMNRTPQFFFPLTNRVSVYLGDMSYSLYLWHFPVLTLLAYLIDPGAVFDIAALLLIFGLSVASYHLVENPIRYSSWLEPGKRALPKLHFSKVVRVAAVASAVLIVCAVSLVAVERKSGPPQLANAAAPIVDLEFTTDGPESQSLADRISAALTATAWPELDPTMDEAIAGPQAPPDISYCSEMPSPPAAECTWGADSAPQKVMIVGDSVAVTYVEVLRRIAEDSAGQWQVRSRAAFGCIFVTQTIAGPNAGMGAACPEHKRDVIAEIKKVRPDILVITNSYRQAWNVDANRLLTGPDWAAGMQTLLDQFADSVGKIVFVTPPPLSIDVMKCYSKLASPATCIGTIDPHWVEMALAERRLASAIGADFVDSRPWFCSEAGQCPSFVGTTPVKRDQVHMTPEYADLITPAVRERLEKEGLLESE